MTTSTDFFADLERQLVTAAAERPARLRRARRRRAAVTVAAVLVAAGLIALAALAALPGSDRTAAPAHHGPSPAALRGIDVVVLDGSSRAGDARAVAGELSAAGASIVTVPDAPSMRHGSDEAATEVFFRPGHQADAITVAGTLQQEHESRYPPVVALPKQLRYVGSRAGIVVVAGSDHFMKPPYAVPAASPPPTNIRVAVLNATTTPGLARGVANRLQAAGFRIGTVTNAADQGRSATLVEYAPGQQAAALTTARAIDVPTNAVQPAAAGSRVIAGESADVVVEVGNDARAR
jgi:hypothetical protein